MKSRAAHGRVDRSQEDRPPFACPGLCSIFASLAARSIFLRLGGRV